MAGGTGGHVVPGAGGGRALARAWRATCVWLGTAARHRGARWCPTAGIPVEWIERERPARQGRRRRCSALPFLLRRCAVAGRRDPAAPATADVVLGHGRLRLRSRWRGGPARCAGRCVVHEQNAVAGLTNRVLARLRRTACSEAFPDSFGRGVRAEHVGNPVRVRDRRRRCRPSGTLRRSREGAAALLVFGGSQGAARAERACCRPPSASCRRRCGPEVLHQTGERNCDEAARGGLPARAASRRDVRPFIDDMASAYGWADLAVCRSGALTVAELAAAGVPARAGAVPGRRRRPPDAQRATLRGSGAAAAAKLELTPSSWRPDPGCSLAGAAARAARGRTAAALGAWPWRRAVTAIIDADERLAGRPPRRRRGGGMTDRMRRIHTIHFVGIGGIGMSGIAEVLLNLGYAVSGLGPAASARPPRRLQSLGARVAHRPPAPRTSTDADVVVDLRARSTPTTPRWSRRCARTHPGRPARRDAGRADALPATRIAVAGTHGKTTTTSLVASVLAEGGIDPTVRHRRAAEERGHQRARSAPARYLVAEADESDALVHCTCSR
ncbi:MAG: glycosyltransferase [Chromatiales bacterium]|nr:glycosyltransferase [Chromatiales bacterium]